MELLAEDQVVGRGATPNASVTTGANTYWLMSTVVLKNASASQLAQVSQALRQSAATRDRRHLDRDAGPRATGPPARIARAHRVGAALARARHSARSRVRCAGRH